MYHRPPIDPRKILLAEVQILLVEHFQFNLSFARQNHVMADRIDRKLQRDQ